jgi:hypothetical protein
MRSEKYKKEKKIKNKMIERGFPTRLVLYPIIYKNANNIQ